MAAPTRGHRGRARPQGPIGPDIDSYRQLQLRRHAEASRGSIRIPLQRVATLPVANGVAWAFVPYSDP
jgi:hypothetical protein